MVPEINIWAVLLATLSSIVVGALWYARPVFGNRWIELTKSDVESVKSSPVVAYIVTILMSFLLALVLAGAAAIAQSFYGGNFLFNTVVTAIILWIGFTAARFITHDVFERRPASLTMLNIGNELVTVVVMA